MGLDDVLTVLRGDGEVPTHPIRGWISHGEEGWQDDLSDVVRAWRVWRGDRPIDVTTTVRGAPTVVELAVGANPPAPATLVWDERPSTQELRIYVDPEDAA